MKKLTLILALIIFSEVYSTEVNIVSSWAPIEGIVFNKVEGSPAKNDRIIYKTRDNNGNFQESDLMTRTLNQNEFDSIDWTGFDHTLPLKNLSQK